MSKPKFNQKRLETFLRNVFPNTKIISFEKFSTGLVSPTFKVKIKNPNKMVVIKLGKLKDKGKIHQNNLILKYLYKNKIPTPEVFLEETFDKKFITIMECSLGKVASEVYKRGNLNLQRKLLFNAGKNLRKIHKLKIPSFWNHQKHEIKSEKEWKNWTKHRVEKYLKFFERKSFPYRLIRSELSDFWEILYKEKIEFVPLHWDYHLSNLNSSSLGEITGTFDFDNAMKGHNLADIGQTEYWLRFYSEDTKNFKYFLKGYGKNFNKKELKLIKGYLILHILAVSRTIWLRKQLNWIIKKHKKMIKELLI